MSPPRRPKPLPKEKRASVADGIQIALIVLLALLVGALLPLLLSALVLMKQARRTLVVLQERSIAFTEKTDKVLARVDHIAEGVQGELPTLRRTSQRVDQLGDSIEKLTETVRKVQAAGNILGPAIAAGINAYRLVKSGQQPGSTPAGPVDPNALPEAVTDAILAEIQAKAEANGDLPETSETNETAEGEDASS